MSRSLVCILLATVFGFLQISCSKNKINALLQPSGSEVASNSSIRLFNFYNYNLDVTVNNIPLTSYGQSTQNGTQAGLSLFPKGSWLTQDNGNPFFVPNSLVTKDRKVHVLISTVAGVLQGISGLVFNFAAIDTVLVDDPLNPKDYYALSTGHLQVVSRNTQAPVQPDHFKIRVINLGAATDPNNLTGPVSLTYSDGSAVDRVLTDVPAGGTSAYVDLPYGAYMFKLFSNDDFSRQLTELPILPNFNSCTVPTPEPQEALWPRVRTFKPGATYSVVVTQNLLIFQPCNSSTPPVPALSNAYRIVTEQSPGPNTTYARMDAFNALPVIPLSIKVDGQPLGSLLPYAGHTDYGIYVQGRHQVQAVDASGNVLVTKSITLSPYDNYTAWIYENTSGRPDICFANTDMTSTLYQTDANGDVAAVPVGTNMPLPPVDDGTNGTIRVVSINYSWQTRFLNLTPDLPFATFANNAATFPAIGFGGANSTGYGDSTSFATASINMAPGVTPDYDPFVIFQYQCNFSSVGSPSYGFVQSQEPNLPNVIRVFQSSPGPPALVPGTLLGSVPPLPAAAYISNPTLYPTPGFLPESEPGVYTTALIGRALTATSGQDAAKLVILKHNK